MNSAAAKPSPGAPPTSPADDSVLRLIGVSKSYGTVRGVDRLSLELKRGEILTLLGPSGCGKTTTLRIAVGLERSSEGAVWFNDRLVDSPAERVFVPPDKRNMGMVFQSYAVWPHMTVFENVAYPLRVRRREAAEIRERVLKTLDLVGLSGLDDRPGTRLSGGQQQRVAVARGLVFGPDLLLMDEPFSNLDAKLREQMRAEVKLLQRRLGISVMFVTHDQIEALALSDRIAVMHRGNMEQIGSPAALYAAPATPAVRDFLGRTLLLPGKIAARSGAARTEVRLSEGALIPVGGADHSAGAAVGNPCVISIRPEHIQVTPRATGNDALHGRILALLFLGERYEASVELPSGAIVEIYLPPTALWREGAEVSLQLPAKEVQLWLPEAAAP